MYNSKLTKEGQKMFLLIDKAVVLHEVFGVLSWITFFVNSVQVCFIKWETYEKPDFSEIAVRTG